MAYYSGTAASLTALRTALLTHAQADGWVLTGDVLSKAGVYFQIQETATHITCLGCENNAVLNPAPNVVSIGRVFEDVSAIKATIEMTFPCTYHVFGFAQALYLIVNYNTDYHQWLAFGKSEIVGLPGQGGWCGATLGSFLKTIDAGPIAISDTTGGAYYSQTSAALFHTVRADNQHISNAWVNSGLDGHGWGWGAVVTSYPVGVRHISTLIAIQPGAWNSESVLLPLRAYKERPSYKSSLVADLNDARILRIDNLAPGDILTIGSDKWKVFPWYLKNLTARNGGAHINHSGTFGWAIRYEGP